METKFVENFKNLLEVSKICFVFASNYQNFELVGKHLLLSSKVYMSTNLNASLWFFGLIDLESQEILIGGTSSF